MKKCRRETGLVVESHFIFFHWNQNSNLASQTFGYNPSETANLNNYCFTLMLLFNFAISMSSCWTPPRGLLSCSVGEGWEPWQPKGLMCTAATTQRALLLVQHPAFLLPLPAALYSWRRKKSVLDWGMHMQSIIK